MCRLPRAALLRRQPDAQSADRLVLQAADDQYIDGGGKDLSPLVIAALAPRTKPRSKAS